MPLNILENVWERACGHVPSYGRVPAAACQGTWLVGPSWTGEKKTILAIVKGLQDAFEKVKIEQGSFEHLGLRHRTVTGGIV